MLMRLAMKSMVMKTTLRTSTQVGAKLTCCSSGFHGVYRPVNWTVQEYVNQWLQYADAINAEVFDTSPNGNAVEPLFQAGVLEPPTKVANASIFNADSMIDDGILRNGEVKTISEHEVRSEVR